MHNNFIIECKSIIYDFFSLKITWQFVTNYKFSKKMLVQGREYSFHLGSKLFHNIIEPILNRM